MSKEDRLREALEAWFGGRWDCDVLPEDDHLAVYVVAQVVEDVERPRYEVAVADVRRIVDPSFEVDDDVLFQVHFLPGTEAAQAHMESLYGELLQLDETFAAGLAQLRAGWEGVLGG